MGLDMFLGGVCEASKECRLFGQWRKHWPLHTYIVTQFAGGMDKYRETHFITVKLSASQLDTAYGALLRGEIERYPDRSLWDDSGIFADALAWLEASDGRKRAVYYEAND
jgi:hypothetical protein